jgi:hypothetical protein
LEVYDFTKRYDEDIIISEAIKAGVPLIELRLISDPEADDTNLLEPCTLGRTKIAASGSKSLRMAALKLSFDGGFN